MYSGCKYVFLLLFACLSLTKTYAQPSATDTLLVGGLVVGNDTLPHIYMDNVFVIDKLPRHLAKRRAAADRLRYNVTKVYPYALIAADVLKDVDVNLDKLSDDRKARKAYLHSVEKELNKRFKGELEDLTITQGQILVKLINRQTGKNCFSIVKELKGGFSAVVWQSVALIFNNSLKREYDPYSRDKEIEAIVQDIEVNNYYQYQYLRQKASLQTRAR